MTEQLNVIWQPDNVLAGKNLPYGLTNISCEIYEFPAENTRAPAGKITPWLLYLLIFRLSGYFWGKDCNQALVLLADTRAIE